MKSETFKFGEQTVTLETGLIAKQANGSIIVRQGDTVVLVTVVAAEQAQSGQDFFPLTVEYRERISAAGRIPGSYQRRETKPADHEILSSRLIDRSIRPLFPDAFKNEVQVSATVLSFAPEGDPEILAILGTTAALAISEIPWQGPVVGVRIVRQNGQLLANPLRINRTKAELDLIVSVGPDGLVMVEGEAAEVSEDIIVEALMFAQDVGRKAFDLLARFAQETGKTKWSCQPAAIDEALRARVRELADAKLLEAMTLQGKKARRNALTALKTEILAELTQDNPELVKTIDELFETYHQEQVRRYIVTQQRRIDGRGFTSVRPISIELGWLPRVHGSAVFTRGETQAIVACTLGVGDDEQRVETLLGEQTESFLLHYNFPPYSVGEIRPFRGPGRREIGHGNLARRALLATLPDQTAFPYTIRIVSDITESNGSSSMATVCGGCLALMDAGVPIAKPTAGVAMGLIKEGDAIAVLTDILGDEDHLGDMDFKVTGTELGVTALQMDNKVGGLSREILAQALSQAKLARLHVLAEMTKVLARPRPTLSPHAPRVLLHYIRPERIRELIGAGGKTIQEIQATHHCRIEVDETGRVKIYTKDETSAARALRRVKYYTSDPELNKCYRGTVTDVKDFGVFVRLFGSIEGLVHISELDQQSATESRPLLQPGATILVRLIGVEKNGKLRLSQIAARNADLSEIIEF